MTSKYGKHLIIIYVLVLSNIIFGQGYKLVWSDEFIGRNLDENIWTHETGGNGWGNEELQYYTNRDTNVFVEDGKLILQALKENHQGKNYTSARLNTQDKISHKYGKIEARIKLPYGQGIWPAFWMLGQNYSSVGWPACGEIDIMEMIGGINNDNRIYGTVHWSNNGSHADYGGNYKLNSGVFSGDFHTFSIEWSPASIKWFVDGSQYHAIDITPSELSEFQQDFFIILNLAVGGVWPGSPDASTVFPQIMEVDYVRVYQDASNFPTVSLIEPINSENYNENVNIPISAIIDYDGKIEKVEFYQDELQIGETDLEPFNMIWRNVSAGNYIIKAKAITDEGYVNESDMINITVGGGAEQFPYCGSAIKIPGIIEAEDFDTGGSNTSFIDNTISNLGLFYRLTESVDIETCSDENGGYNVGWTEPGEWIKYTTNVQKTAEYELIARVATENSGGSFSIEVDGVAATELISVPNTGGWQDWTSVSSTIKLNEGVHEFKFIVGSGEFNVNRFEIYEPNTEPQVTLLSPTGGEILEIGSIQEILWTHLKVDEVSIGLSTDGGSSWSFIGKEIPAKYGFYRWLVPENKSDNCLVMIIDAKSSAVNDINDSTFNIDFVNSIELLSNISNGYSLLQNYPNPFNPETVIGFSIPHSTHVNIKLFDQLGREVKLLVNEFKIAGQYNYKFSGSELSSGVYYYKIETDKFSDIKKMILLK